MKNQFFLSGIGTEIGKTVVAATLVEALHADYWKPIQSGDLDNSDSLKIQRWVSNPLTRIHPERFRLNTPLSPHASAAIDGVEIKIQDFQLPDTTRPLIVEGAGGLMVPLNHQETMLDLIQHLNLPVILVSRHYLGSINHTLLSLEVLRSRGIELAGLLYNGAENVASEQAIEELSGIKVLGRVGEMGEISAEAIAREAAVLRELLRI
ncbi:dethiobiotin synthase [Haliscomenobacter hydrossis]|uniref:ATP-dependent dethiobiotin synthetase BioD n=1 Tax=Haliscomenobacter hydrossis (strain ATCC 27775 / DSM 1100 / LMG 10767 / O) TaxID=760192 RepID=F4L5Z4_HALH1|nr:dethiobiotin synthase [Haliscomenobacter hydrossis]AEE53054.1 Dethiobiotin synthetase [Haliscomenobacter hydrossis DSM 1100]